MGSPHPLDIFRSSEQGFDEASRMPRKRRTVKGKIVRSEARADRKPRTPPPPPSRSKSKSKAKARTRRSTDPKVSNRALLYTALGITAVVAGWIVVPQWFAGGDELPALRRETVMSTRSAPEESAPAEPAPGPAQEPPPAAPAQPVAYTVRVATYDGSQQVIAQEAAGELSARGFDVNLVGFPGEDGGFARIELVVGEAVERDDLLGVRDQLRNINDWGSGREIKPFHDARIVEHPLPAALPTP